MQLLALSVLLGAALAQPTFNYYTIDAIFSLPYNGISEPIRTYYDGINNKSRTDYYGGLDTYIYRPDLFDFGVLLEIVPVTTNDYQNQTSCFQNNGTSDGPTTIQSIIPDLSLFTNSSQLAYARGVLCENWIYVFVEDNVVNTYNFYINAVTGEPVQYHMLGYDTLFGSHYDEYVLDYQTYSTGPINPTIFDPPLYLPCGAFPGPGASDARDPRGALGEIENLPEHKKTWDTRFEAHKAKYGKTYTDKAEHETRKTNFRNNYRYVSSMNRKQLSYKLAVNHLGDLSAAEMKAMRGRRSSRSEAEIAARSISSGKVYDGPAFWDWRQHGAVTPVKDQGMCGSCWSFGTAESIEGAWFIKTNNLIPISEQAFMDCSWGYGNNACDGGEAFRAYSWALDHGGFVPAEAAYGLYMMADGLCHVRYSDDDDDGEMLGVKISGYVNVTSDVDDVLTAISLKGPLAVAIDASHPSFSFYSSGVYYEPTCGNTDADLDHEVLAVGFGTDPVGGDYWIVKNSWSQHWGNEGYVFMSRQNNNCGVATDANYPIV